MANRRPHPAARARMVAAVASVCATLAVTGALAFTADDGQETAAAATSTTAAATTSSTTTSSTTTSSTATNSTAATAAQPSTRASGSSHGS